MSKTSEGGVEIIRHGPKDESGNLSPEGIESIRKEAEILFKRVCASAVDSIFYLVPSNVSRSQGTRSVIEERLRELVADAPEEGIEIVPSASQENITKGAGKKYIITDIAPVEAMGFQRTEPWVEAFYAYEETLGDEFTARLWTARDNEMDAFRADVKKQFPKISKAELKDLRPSKFVTTPEEVALRQIEAIEQMTYTMNEAHPGQPLMGTYIGHAPGIDFVAMAVLGEDINLANFKRIEGLRKFLESSTFQIENGEVVMASFRGRSLAGKTSLAEIKTKLTVQSEARKQEWES